MTRDQWGDYVACCYMKQQNHVNFSNNHPLESDVEGFVGRGRPKKSWINYVKDDMDTN